MGIVLGFQRASRQRAPDSLADNVAYWRLDCEPPSAAASEGSLKAFARPLPRFGEERVQRRHHLRAFADC
jgi:hypothetical protein